MHVVFVPVMDWDHDKELRKEDSWNSTFYITSTEWQIIFLSIALEQFQVLWDSDCVHHLTCEYHLL
jgi:hypothetical protein